MASLSRFIFVLFLVSALFPFWRISGSFPDIRPEIVLVIGAWYYIILISLQGVRLRMRWWFVYNWFIFFFVSVFVSLTYAIFFKNQPFTWRDLWELAKPLLYFMVFSLVSSQGINESFLLRFYKFVLLVFIGSAMFAFAQYANLFEINSFVSAYYAPTQIEGIVRLKRVTGTTPNPNEFGALMMFAVALALAGLLFAKERSMQLVSWLAFIICESALVLSLSRTALVASVIALGFVFWSYLRSYKHVRSSRLIILLFLAGIIIASTAALLPRENIDRYMQLLDLSNAPSWKARLQNWISHYRLWLESPLLGWGPGKANMGTIVDNEWLLLLRRYGILGVVIFVLWWKQFFVDLYYIKLYMRRDKYIVSMVVALRGVFVGNIVYMFFASFYHSLQLTSVFLILLGVIYSRWATQLQRLQEAA